MTIADGAVDRDGATRQARPGAARHDGDAMATGRADDRATSAVLRREGHRQWPPGMDEAGRVPAERLHILRVGEEASGRAGRRRAHRGWVGAVPWPREHRGAGHAAATGGAPASARCDYTLCHRRPALGLTRAQPITVCHSGSLDEGRRRQGDRAQRAARRARARGHRQADRGRPRGPRPGGRRRRRVDPGRRLHARPAHGRGRGAACTREADVVLRVQRPTPEEIGKLHAGQVVIGLLQPLIDPQNASRWPAPASPRSASTRCRGRCRAPRRWTRSRRQANVGGYKAVLIAAEAYGRYFPLLTTAAGTAKPANVLILGIGVAGLQAIATARRLGARRQGLRRPLRDARAGRVARRAVPQAQVGRGRERAAAATRAS